MKPLIRVKKTVKLLYYTATFLPSNPQKRIIPADLNQRKYPSRMTVLNLTEGTATLLSF